MENIEVDWYEQAALSAANYLDLMSFSRKGLIDQLIFEGFTEKQAVYAVEENGYYIDQYPMFRYRLVNA